MSNFFDSNDFEVIGDDEIESVRRGRQPNPIAVELAGHLENVERGTNIRITKMTASTDAEKQANGQIIRNAAKMAGRKVGIRWSKSGVPQITVKI